jgi:hypothetical protein
MGRRLAEIVAALLGALLAFAAAGRPAVASDLVPLGILDLEAYGAPEDVARAVNKTLSVIAERVPGYGLCEKVTLPRSEILKTVGCTTPSARCLADFASSVMYARKLLTGEIRYEARAKRLTMRILLMDVPTKSFERSYEKAGSVPELVAAVRPALRWLLRPATAPLLVVRSAPAGALATVDGKRIGETPVRLVSELLPGKHVVRLSKKGFVDFLQTVVIKAGATASVEAALAKM